MEDQAIMATPSKSSRGKHKSAKQRGGRAQQHPQRPTTAEGSTIPYHESSADESATRYSQGANVPTTPQASRSKAYNSDRSTKKPLHHQATQSHIQHYNPAQQDPYAHFSHHSANSYSHSNGYQSDQTHHQNHNPHANLQTPVKQAYAGPTFHASPAASSLPIPKLASRSTPTQKSTSPSAFPPGPGSSGEPASDTAEISSLGAIKDSTPSPLDIFFNAHRAEKRSQSRENTPERTSYFTPDRSTRRQHLPTNTSASGARLSESKQAFLREIEGVSDQSEEEAESHAIPFQARMQSPFEGSSTATPEEKQRQAQTLALKRALKLDKQQSSEDVHVFAAHNRESASPSPLRTLPNSQSPQHSAWLQDKPSARPTGQQRDSFSNIYKGYGQSPHPGYGQPKTQTVSPQADSNLNDMEENLKRILKLSSQQ